MKKTLLFLIIFASIACSCKKYEEGPCISFRSAKNRIYGNYTLTSLTVDGEDCLSQYYDSLSPKFEFFNEKNHDVDRCYMYGTNKNGWGSDFNWTWELIDHNKILKIKTAGGNLPGMSYGPFKNGVLPEWEILRLTKKEKKFKTIYSNKEYVITLEYPY